MLNVVTVENDVSYQEEHALIIRKCQTNELNKPNG